MKGQREYEERNLLVGVIGAFALFVQIGDSHKNSTGNRWRYQHYGWITDGQDNPDIKGYVILAGLRRRDIRSGTSIENPLKSTSIGQYGNLPRPVDIVSAGHFLS